eukprot:COSAG01_NODE_3573_length_5920_cov_3.554372_3_plen_211_part_00
MSRLFLSRNIEDGIGRAGTSPYDRFPAAFQGTVEAEVWEMSRWSSGEFLLFESNSTRFWLNITLQVPYRHYEALMPETGHSGCDLYTYDTTSRSWLWVGSNFPSFFSGNATLVGEIFSDGSDTNGAFWRPNAIPPQFFSEPRHYILYLPLYNGPSHMSVGVNQGSFARAADATWPASQRFCEQAPIIWYAKRLSIPPCALGSASKASHVS